MKTLLKTKFLYLFLIIFALLLFSTQAFAQEDDDETVKKHGISFPIAELGNCGSILTCKAFCDNEANREACLSFAKKKGLGKAAQGAPSNSKIMEEAKSSLGCDSESSCRSVCEQEENREKCQQFANRHGLGGPKGKPGDRNVIEKAKTILGCDSESSCRSICEKEENQQKCSEFAKQTGLGGGVRRVGPGGCNSEESCRSFCENNKEECRKFGGSPEGADGGRRGPGGCNSEESCRAYCETHPGECGASGGPGPQDMESSCKENPDKCSGGRFTGPGGERMGENPEEFCKQNPDRCKPPGESFRRPGESIQPEFREGESRTFQQIPTERPDTQTETTQQTFTQQPSGEDKTFSESNSTTQTSGGETREVRGVSTATGILDRVMRFFGF